jgi:L,D-transpeptidase ErfK/SrfK
VVPSAPEPAARVARGLALVAGAFAAVCGAASYPLPPASERLFGELSHDVVAGEDTLIDIARRNRLGYDEITLANPDVDHWLPKPGTHIVLPTRFILPWGEREGIVVNLAEYRLYYFPPPRRGAPAAVETYAVSAGRNEWPTPRVLTKISRKLENPAWYPNRAIRDEHAADGDSLPSVVPAGHDNPLGRFVLKLGMAGGYFIHGTSKPFGIGMNVTHGCLRLYPEDIEQLFARVATGTKVRIIDEPYKATWKAGVLYLEAHGPLDENGVPRIDRGALERRLRRALQGRPGRVDPAWLEEFIRRADGIPTPVPLITSPATS